MTNTSRLRTSGSLVGSKWNDGFGYMDDDLIVHPYNKNFESILTESDYVVEFRDKRLGELSGSR